VPSSRRWSHYVAAKRRSSTMASADTPNVVIRQISQKYGQLAALEGRAYVITIRTIGRPWGPCLRQHNTDNWPPLRAVHKSSQYGPLAALVGRADVITIRTIGRPCVPCLRHHNTDNWPPLWAVPMSSQYGQLAALGGRAYVITKLPFFRYGLYFLFLPEEGKTQAGGSRTPHEHA
jgi:hypothetical protein